MRKELTLEQATAAHASNIATAVLAGAGSGKTTVLVERFLTLMDRGLKPHEILTVTFTTDAADQLKARIQSSLKSEEARAAVESSPYIGTIHGFCYRILDQHGSHIGLEPVRKIVSTLDWAAAYQNAYSEWLRELAPDTLRALLKRFLPGDLRDLTKTFYRNRYFFRQELASHLSILDEAEKEIFTLLQESTGNFFRRVEEQFHKRGWYSFDDLEHLTLAIFQRSPETVEKLRVDLKAVLVDEFQDTSPLQWQILEPLVRQDTKRLFVVGDPKQSIYSFRDADVALFLRTCDDIAKSNGLVQELSVNFRTAEETLSPINALSAKLFANGNIPFSPMTSGASAHGAGLTFLRYPTGEAKLKSELVQEETRRVADFVKEKIAEGARPGDIAILFRASERMPEFASALAVHGIASHSQATGKLGDYFSALDLLHYLKAIRNPLDDFSLGAFLRSPYVGLSYSELLSFVPPRGESLWSRVETHPKIAWFAEWVRGGNLDFEPSLHALFRNTGKSPVPDSVLLTLYRTLSDYRDLDVLSAIELLEAGLRENILLEESSAPEDAGAVKLMTIHSAKGLEYPHVILVDLLRVPPRGTPLIRCVPSYPPGIRYRKDDEWESSTHFAALDRYFGEREEEESKRILYVAMTRAIESLTVSLPEDEKWIPKDSWAGYFTTAGKDANDSSM